MNTRKKFFGGLAAGAAALALTACLMPVGDGEGLDESGEPEVAIITLEKVYADVFSSKCQGCHSGATPSGNLDLSSVNNALNEFFEADSVTPRPTDQQPNTAPNVYVLPGSPEGSFLYQKLITSTPKYGNKMPLIGTLTPTQLNLVRNWILGGALIRDTTTGNTP